MTKNDKIEKALAEGYQPEEIVSFLEKLKQKNQPLSGQTVATKPLELGQNTPLEQISFKPLATPTGIEIGEMAREFDYRVQLVKQQLERDYQEKLRQLEHRQQVEIEALKRQIKEILYGQ